MDQCTAGHAREVEGQGHRSAAEINQCPLANRIDPCTAPQDTRLKWKGKVGKNDLTLKQHVPDGKWALVPNPGELA